MSNFDVSSATYNPALRKLETTDPTHADIFNAALSQLINNDVAINKVAIHLDSEKNKINSLMLDIQTDLSDVIFQLAVQELLNTSNFSNVVVDVFESEDDLRIVSGAFSESKVYI